jgi:hypothetical protein
MTALELFLGLSSATVIPGHASRESYPQLGPTIPVGLEGLASPNGKRSR